MSLPSTVFPTFYNLINPGKAFTISYINSFTSSINRWCRPGLGEIKSILIISSSKVFRESKIFLKFIFILLQNFSLGIYSKISLISLLFLK